MLFDLIQIEISVYNMLFDVIHIENLGVSDLKIGPKTVGCV